VGTGGDSLPKHRPVRWYKVHYAVGESCLLEDLEDEIVGKDGRVTRLPQRHVALRGREKRSVSERRIKTLEKNGLYQQNNYLPIVYRYR
jgi:hypothetical protein